MKIKGIEFSEETIVKALEKAGFSLEEPKKKETFEPIVIDKLTVGIESGTRGYFYLHIKKNVRIVSGLDNSDGRACWFSDGERDMIIEAIQEAKEFRNKK